MKTRINAAVLLVATALGVLSAHAQVSIDVAKITCHQLFFDKVISPNEKSLALWLSGYYNAKRDNAVLDVGALAKNTDKVEDYCRMHEDATVMDAVKNVLGSAR